MFATGIFGIYRKGVSSICVVSHEIKFNLSSRHHYITYICKIRDTRLVIRRIVTLEPPLHHNTVFSVIAVYRYLQVLIFGIYQLPVDSVITENIVYLGDYRKYRDNRGLQVDKYDCRYYTQRFDTILPAVVTERRKINVLPVREFEMPPAPQISP